MHLEFGTVIKTIIETGYGTFNILVFPELEPSNRFRVRIGSRSRTMQLESDPVVPFRTRLVCILTPKFIIWIIQHSHLTKKLQVPPKKLWGMKFHILFWQICEKCKDNPFSFKFFCTIVGPNALSEQHSHRTDKPQGVKLQILDSRRFWDVKYKNSLTHFSALFVGCWFMIRIVRCV